MANTTGEKVGGWKAGIPNKMTAELRESLRQIVSNEIELLQERLEQLDPKERTELLLKILPFVLPKPDPENNFAGMPYLHRLQALKGFLTVYFA